MVAVDFDLWAQRSDTLKIYLVALTALRLADQAQIPLYLSRGKNLILNGCSYLDCVAGLPRLIYQANGNSDPLSEPNRVPTWGEMEINIEPEYRPDASNSLTWRDLLSSAYNLRGQEITIKLGGEEFSYTDFRTIFSGRIEQYSWNDSKLTLKIYGRERDFDQEIGGYDLPECPFVAEACWGQQLPIVLGRMLNYKPVLISDQEAGDFPWRYALAGHVINAVTSVYFNNEPQCWMWNPQPTFSFGIREITEVPFMEFRAKDVLPAHKNGEGTATMQTFGPYAGSLYVAEWRVEIDSITRLNEVGQYGPEVGLATFKWYLNGVLQASGILTWKLAPGEVTKDPALGGSVLTLGGEYTGEIKRQYRLKITQTGTWATPGKFRVSEDGGATWSAEINITNGDPIDIGRGLTAAFTDAGRMTAPVKTPGSDPPSDGAITVSGAYTGATIKNFRVQIVLAGEVGVARYNWSNNGGDTWNETNVLTSTEPHLMSDGVSVAFANSFAVDDRWDWVAYPPFVVDDIWAFTFEEIPIPLAQGVFVQFYTQAGTDFAVGDDWRFPLGSTLCIANVGQGVNVTADAEGLVSPADNLYADKAGRIIQALLMAWRGWTTADFDQAALAAFIAAIPYQMELLVDGPTAIKDIIKDLLQGIPAIYTFDHQQRLFLVEMTPPSGEADMELTDVEFLKNPEQEDGGESLCWRVYLHYGKNHNVENNPAGAPTQERVEFLRREYRLVRRQDETVLASYPWAKDLGPLNSCLLLRADALAVADKLLTLLKTRRFRAKITTKVQTAHRRIWDKFLIKRTRFGEETGQLYALEGMEQNLTNSEAILSLWR